MISTPDNKLNPRKRPAIPPKDTNKSTHPNKTSLLYRMIGQVRYSMLTYVSNGFEGSVVLSNNYLHFCITRAK